MTHVLSRQEYGVQDTILQYISSNFVSVNERDRKDFNKHLKFVVESLIQKMKDVDKFFCTLFQKDCVAGSFWDGLKIGKPVEFDKNLVLSLPSSFMKHIQFLPASPSFVIINVGQGFQGLKKSDKWETYRKIENWLDDRGNIISDKVRFWMESVVDKAVKTLSEEKFILKHPDGQTTYKLSTRKSGPAMTIEVQVHPENRKFDIDLVPSFEFSPKHWPKHITEYSENITVRPWHVVPKPIRPDEDSQVDPCLQWRLSFHDQESKRIHNTGQLKAVLKLIKKMRDFKRVQLSSYAIKTVFIWEMDVQQDNFWNQSLSKSFLHMLYVLTERLKSGHIPFYWDKNHNLLGKLRQGQREDASNTIRGTYNQIINTLKEGNDWFIIARNMLTDDEFFKMESEIQIEKRERKVVARLRRTC